MSTVKEVVKEKYGQAALRVVSGAGNACCGASPSSCCSDSDPITSKLYDELQKSELPETAVLASLGCGNPTALAELRAGEVVLDLGSGGGIDVLLSAKRVSPGGKAYGLDMTDEMLSLARENQKKSGLTNVDFLKGEIESIPLPDNTVDVIISNCVINLSADKDKVLREAFRVLKPGGRFAVSDIVTRGQIPEQIRKNLLLWAGCVAGALDEKDYLSKLAGAGFERASIEPTRVYQREEARSFLAGKGVDLDSIGPEIDGAFYSGFIRASKPFAWTIRPAAPADLNEVQTLLGSSGLPADGLADQFPAGYAVAVAGGQVVGVAGVETHGASGLLRSVAVKPALRSAGLGAALVRERAEWARTNGLDSAYLLTTSAAGYFPRFGFVPISREQAPEGIRGCVEFTSACPSSAVLMRLPLTEAAR